MRRGAHSLPTPFFDAAITIALVLLAWTFFTAPRQHKTEATTPITQKAEFLIQLSWQDNSEDDLDLWVEGPDGKIVFYKSKAQPYMYLDHDETGHGDTVASPDGSIHKVPARLEVVTIRAIVPGDYAVNCHSYHKDSGPSVIDHATLRIIKLSPFRIVTETSADFDAQGEEKTLANFTVVSDGSVSSVYLEPIKMVGQQQ